MKKILVALLILVSMVSCEKLHPCYTCELTNVMTGEVTTEKWCGDSKHIFKDENGNDLQSFCHH